MILQNLFGGGRQSQQGSSDARNNLPMFEPLQPNSWERGYSPFTDYLMDNPQLGGNLWGSVGGNIMDYTSLFNRPEDFATLGPVLGMLGSPEQMNRDLGGLILGQLASSRGTEQRNVEQQNTAIGTLEQSLGNYQSDDYVKRLAASNMGSLNQSTQAALDRINQNQGASGFRSSGTSNQLRAMTSQANAAANASLMSEAQRYADEQAARTRAGIAELQSGIVFEPDELGGLMEFLSEQEFQNRFLENAATQAEQELNAQIWGNVLQGLFGLGTRALL